VFRCETKWKTPEIWVFSSTVYKQFQKELCADLRTSSVTCSGNMPTVRTDLQFNIISRDHDKDLRCPICASYTHTFTAVVSRRNLIVTEQWAVYLGQNLRSVCIWTEHNIQNSLKNLEDFTFRTYLVLLSENRHAYLNLYGCTTECYDIYKRWYVSTTIFLFCKYIC